MDQPDRTAGIFLSASPANHDSLLPSTDWIEKGENDGDFAIGVSYLRELHTGINKNSMKISLNPQFSELFGRDNNSSTKITEAILLP
jgi:hypothetical protein